MRSLVQRKFPDAKRIGVLASDFVREKRLFERYFAAPEFEVVYPRAGSHADTVTEAIYGADGIKSGNLRGRPVALLRAAAESLVEQGVDVIVPGMTEIALVAGEIGSLPVSLVDSNLAYAQFIVSGRPGSPAGVLRSA